MRRLLVVLGAVAIVAAGAVVFVVLPSDSESGGSGSNRLNELRSYQSGNFRLVLNDQTVAPVKVLSSGNAFTDVVNEVVGTDGVVRKHITGPKYEDLIVEVTNGYAAALYQWIAQSWQPASPAPLTAALVALDYNYNVQARTNFYNARLVATEIPLCDSSSKEPAPFTLTIRFEYSRAVSPAAGPLSLSAASEKMIASNCRFTLSGIDTTKVSRVEAITVKRPWAETGARDSTVKSEPPQFPNVKVTFADASAATWNAWFTSFVLRGLNSQAYEKAGSFQFLSANYTTQLARMDLAQCGIVKVGRVATSGDTIARSAAELYCEQMAFLSPVP